MKLFSAYDVIADKWLYLTKYITFPLLLYEY